MEVEMGMSSFFQFQKTRTYRSLYSRSLAPWVHPTGSRLRQCQPSLSNTDPTMHSITRIAVLTLALASTTLWAQNATTAAAAKEPGAVVSSTGLVYRALKEGNGASPKASDTVKVHYRGTLPDGKEFDSSYKRGEPIEFPLNRVIPCWTEGVQRMKVGGKAKLTCPPQIAYGANGAGGVIPPNATLLFEVELLGINGK
jgi:FKBP-type peptidyl-prolyl cis-trans isomerase FkpA